MANIKKLGMAEQLLANPHISIRKSFFGLATAYIYNPTGSKIKVVQKNYNPGDGDSIKHMLSLGVESLKKGLKGKGLPQPIGIGNMQLNICYTEDHQFLAIQMEQFMDYLYQPTTDLVVAEGEDAQQILTAIKL